MARGRRAGDDCRIAFHGGVMPVSDVYHFVVFLPGDGPRP
jgi:hypothetical protein